GSVELRIRANLGVRRQRTDTQEVVDRADGIARRLLRFGLLVNRRRDALLDGRTIRIVRRQEALRANVGGFGFGVALTIEQRVREERGRRALVAALHRRVGLQDLLATFDDASEL